jgi:spore coat polysaccharide biosynthesis protein SpsF
MTQVISYTNLRDATEDTGENNMIIIQARTGSSRLPGKVLRELGGRPVLSWVIRAAELAETGQPVVVATSDRAPDDEIESLANSHGVGVTRGPENDVLQRFILAIEEHGGAKAIVRLTADNPLLDPRLIAAAWAAFSELGVSYLSTTLTRSLPRGMDVEVADVDALRAADRSATGADRSHVTSYLYRETGRFLIAGMTFSPSASDLRVTLDTAADAALLDAVVDELGDRPPTWWEVVRLLRARPDIAALNADVRQKPLESG